MKYLWTTIHVKNLDESILFYSELLNLQLQQRFSANPITEIAFMGNNIDNETQIELCFDQSCSHIDFTSSISIGFAVESISHIVSKLNNMKIDVIYGPIETAPLFLPKQYK